MHQGHLFCLTDFGTFAAHAAKQLEEMVERAQPAELADETLPGRLARALTVATPELDADRKTAQYKNIQLDVSQDPWRLVTDRSRPVFVSGTEVIVSVPFRGDSVAFRIRPRQHALNPPQGTVGDQEVRLTYRTGASSSEPVRGQIERDIKDIRQHLAWLDTDLENYRRELPLRAAKLIADRLKHIERQQAFVSGIGIPVREDAPLPPSPPRPAPSAPRPIAAGPGATPSWDLFICHASEDKEAFVRPLAEALTARSLSVWYDETSLKLGDSLRAEIDKGLARSRFGVVVLSKHFFQKHWPQRELDGLANRERDGRKVILPVWHEVEENDVAEFSPTLAGRLAVRSSQGVGTVVEAIARAMDHQ